jgi:hypothetical protein
MSALKISSLQSALVSIRNPRVKVPHDSKISSGLISVSNVMSVGAKATSRTAASASTMAAGLRAGMPIRDQAFRKEVSGADCFAFLVELFPVHSLIDAVANAAFQNALAHTAQLPFRPMYRVPGFGISAYALSFGTMYPCPIEQITKSLIVRVRREFLQLADQRTTFARG